MARTTHNPKRRGFTLVELLVVIAIIASLLGLLLPAVQSAREAARRTQCMTNIRSLGQAAAVFESARMKLPAAMDRVSGTAGAAGTTGAYSWIFMLLPYLEDKQIYDNVSANTGKLQQGPFTTTVGSNAVIGQGNTGEYAATLSNLAYVQCPSSSVGNSVDTTLYWSGTATGGSAASDVVLSTSTSSAGTACGRSSYHAMVGANVTSGTYFPSQAAGAIVLTPPTGGSTFGLAGVTAGQVSDGLTKTIFFIESRERTYASWIDGATTWVTALKGGSTLTLASGTWNNTSTAHNASGFMTKENAGGRIANNRDWGPSSEHSGGIVVAVFGDTHVQPITGDVAPGVFAAWSTRGGNESNGGVTQ